MNSIAFDVEPGPEFNEAQRLQRAEGSAIALIHSLSTSTGNTTKRLQLLLVAAVS